MAMKKLLVLLFGVIGLLGLSGCKGKEASPIFPKERAWLVQLAYSVGEERRELSFSDAHSVSHICDDLNSLTLEPLEEYPEREARYTLTLYGEAAKVLQYIHILDDNTLGIEGIAYRVAEGELDLAYLEEAIETMDYVLSTTG